MSSGHVLGGSAEETFCIVENPENLGFGIVSLTQSANLISNFFTTVILFDCHENSDSRAQVYFMLVYVVFLHPGNICRRAVNGIP